MTQNIVTFVRLNLFYLSQTRHSINKVLDAENCHLYHKVFVVGICILLLIKTILNLLHASIRKIILLYKVNPSSKDCTYILYVNSLVLSVGQRKCLFPQWKLNL